MGCGPSSEHESSLTPTQQPLKPGAPANGQQSASRPEETEEIHSTRKEIEQRVEQLLEEAKLGEAGSGPAETEGGRKAEQNEGVDVLERS